MQTLSLDEDIYFLLVLGMVAVGAHAFTLFNQRIVAKESSQRWRFLANVPIQLITSRSSFNFGFIVYLILFELIYLILASSSSLVLMMYQLSGREELTGALSEGVKPNGAVPILASTGIILLSQIPPFSNFEVLLRSMAHRFAEIPDGLKSVKQNLIAALKKNPLSLHRAVVEHNVSSTNVGSDISGHQANLSNKNDAKLVLADIDHWVNIEFGVENAGKFKTSYWNLLCLNEYTLDSTGSSLWDAEESEEILRLFRSSEHEVAQLRATVEAAALKTNSERNAAHTEDPKTEGQHQVDRRADGIENADVNHSAGVSQWKSHLKACLQLEERFVLLLSLLIINQPDVQSTDDEQLRRIIDAAHQRKTSAVLNSTLRTLLLGGIASFVAIAGYFLLEAQFRNMIRVSPYENKAPYGEYVQDQVLREIESAKLYRWNGMDLIERTNATSKTADLFFTVSNVFNRAFNETLVVLLLFGSSVLTALGIREHYLKLREWNVRRQNRKLVVPVAKYYLSCSIATLCSLAVIFVYFFIKLALVPALNANTDILSLDIIEPFLTFMPSLLLTSLIAWVCAYFALYLYDVVLLETQAQTQRQNATSSSAGNEEASKNRYVKFKFRRKIGICLFFAANCAIVALITSVYLNNVSSYWSMASTLAINVTAFTIVFYIFFGSVAMYSDNSTGPVADVSPTPPMDAQPIAPNNSGPEDSPSADSQLNKSTRIHGSNIRTGSRVEERQSEETEDETA